MTTPYRCARRDFLLASLGAELRAGSRHLETLRDWFHADPEARQQGLQEKVAVIQRMDATIRAWVLVSPQAATGKGKLSGIPFGAKDIMETKGLSTAYGSPVYEGRLGKTDAAIVRDLRQRGAVLLGKTQTAAFAIRDPPPTRNPHDLQHTPGGSSSGSAAAVAAGLVPFALGTQTAGSVLRPASYCGITGFKPTYGLFSLEGVLPYSKSCDTLGFFTHTPEDMLLLWQALDRRSVPDEDFPVAVPDPLPEVEPEMKDGFERAILALRSAGMSIETVDIAAMLAKLVDAHHIISYYEGARFHRERFNEFGTRLGDGLVKLVREGLQISDSQYKTAKDFVSESQERLSDLYERTLVILVPAATGPAPTGLSFTGDARLNAPWTAAGTPAISIPMPIAEGLPLGLQLTADRHQDARVLQAAIKVQRLLNSNHQQES